MIMNNQINYYYEPKIFISCCEHPVLSIVQCYNVHIQCPCNVERPVHCVLNTLYVICYLRCATILHSSPHLRFSRPGGTLAAPTPASPANRRPAP